MSQHEPPREADKDPRYLSSREFQVLADYRLTQLEDRLGDLVRALWTMAGGIIVGVVVFFLTVGRPTAKAALGLLGLS